MSLIINIPNTYIHTVIQITTPHNVIDEVKFEYFSCFDLIEEVKYRKR